MLYLNMSRVAFEITHTASISMHLMNIQYKYIESIQNTGTQFQNKHTHNWLVSLLKLLNCCTKIYINPHLNKHSLYKYRIVLKSSLGFVYVNLLWMEASILCANTVFKWVEKGSTNDKVRPFTWKHRLKLKSHWHTEARSLATRS